MIGMRMGVAHYVENGKAHAEGGGERLEPHPHRHPPVDRRAGGDVVVVVRVGEIVGVEQILDIGLQLHRLADVEEQRCIDAGKAGKACRGNRR